MGTGIAYHEIDSGNYTSFDGNTHMPPEILIVILSLGFSLVETINIVQGIGYYQRIFFGRILLPEGKYNKQQDYRSRQSNNPFCFHSFNF
jgi:hypothetical protein